MSQLGRFLSALRAGLFSPRTALGCDGCRYFMRNKSAIRAALPGLETFSSIDASVRANDGVCVHHQCVTNGARRCADYAEFSVLS